MRPFFPTCSSGRWTLNSRKLGGIHQLDLADGLGAVELPGALARKYPRASREWGWQWVFPASWKLRLVDSDAGVRSTPVWSFTTNTSVAVQPTTWGRLKALMSE